MFDKHVGQHCCPTLVPKTPYVGQHCVSTLANIVFQCWPTLYRYSLAIIEMLANIKKAWPTLGHSARVECYGQQAWDALMELVAYIREHHEQDALYISKGSSSDLVLSAYADADWNATWDARSTTGLSLIHI